MKWYNLQEVQQEQKKDKEMEEVPVNFGDRLFRTYIKKNTQVVEKIKQINLPLKGEQLRIITTSIFNSISIVSHVANKECIEDALFIVFAINQHAARLILRLLKEKKIKNIEMVVSSIRNAGWKSKSKAVEMLKQYVPIIFVNSHAKIIILKTENNYYIIEGSGNLSFNGRIEQYVIDNDEKLYNFSKEWMKELYKFKKS